MTIKKTFVLLPKLTRKVAYLKNENTFPSLVSLTSPLSDFEYVSFYINVLGICAFLLFMSFLFFNYYNKN